MYWLSALSMPEALREGLQMFGLWSEELGGPVQRFSTQVIALLGWRWIRSHWSHLFGALPCVWKQVALVVEHLCGPNQ